MTPKDKQAIINRAKKAGKTTSEFMIDTALHHKIIVIDSLTDVLTELKAIGRNFNQLTLLANMGKIKTVNLESFEDQLSDIHMELSKITEVL